MRTFSALLAAFLVASTVLGWDVSERRKGYPDLCLLSFICCDNEEHCSLPSGAYPYYPTSSNTEYPLTSSDQNYTIQWQAKKQSDVPVGFERQIDDLTWATNVTGTEFIFNPHDILNSFPTQQWPNISHGDAWYAASQSPRNIIRIARANEVQNDSHPVGDYSRQFTVQPGLIKNYIDTQREIGYNKEYNIRNSARESMLTYHAGCGGAVYLVAARPLFCYR